jgi:hypothetical protein
MDNEITKELLELVKENPDLPIVPMVFYEVVAGDDFSYWLGKIVKVEIREFAIDYWYGDGAVKYKDDYDAEESLIEAIAEVKYDGTEEDYEKASEEVKNIWTKAIIMFVGV